MQFITGGPIVTMGAGAAEAVAIENGHIVAVGDARDVLGKRRTADEVTDLAGMTLTPGLIEPHTHPDLSAQLYSWVDISGFTYSSVSGVEAALSEAAALRAPGEWIFGFGLDPMLTPDLGIWDRHRLDAISTEHPIVVMLQSMHTMYANSAALAAAGIDENTPDPPGGGHYARDAAGHPTGRIAEQSAMLPLVIFDMPTREKMLERLAAQSNRYREVGITTVGVAGSVFPTDVFRETFERPDSPLRSVAYLQHGSPDLAGTSPADQLANGSDRFRIHGVKLWYDGSPYTGTMLMEEPYLASDLCCCTLGIPEGTVGQANFEPAEVTELLRSFGEDGWQVLTHSQGDRSSREMLDFYEEVLTDVSPTDHRWRLEHCALTTADDLARARRLGVSPSFHVDHIRHYGPELEAEIIGRQRADKLMPIGTAVEQGHQISLHADSPMYPPSPLKLMETAVTRRTRLGTRIAPEQAISVERALSAVTSEAAWQLGLDDKVGSIEVGKRADFTVLERNPLDAPGAELGDIEVIGTWLDGEPTTPL